jgi:hypothetical protein
MMMDDAIWYHTLQRCMFISVSVYFAMRIAQTEFILMWIGLPKGIPRKQDMFIFKSRY